MSRTMSDETQDRADTLVLENVSREFGSVTVLDDISLTVKPGSVVGVIGPNGSGKTTLLQIVTGLLGASAGTVEHPTAADRPIGYLPQHPALRAPMTVYETLSFYRSLLDPSVTVDPIMEVVGLTPVRDRRVGALSGGMRQLLGLGIAMLGDPPLVILDEPTSGLDPRNTEHIFEAVTALARDDTSVLLTTHDLVHVDATDKIIVLDAGRVIVQTSPADLLERTGEITLVDAFHSILGSGPTVQTGRDDR